MQAGSGLGHGRGHFLRDVTWRKPTLPPCRFDCSSELGAPMRLTPSRRGHPQGRFVLALVFVAGLLITVVIFMYLRGVESERVRARLERDAALPSELLKHKLEEALLVTRSLGLFVATTDEMTRERFAAFVKPLMPPDSEIATIAWVPEVPAGCSLVWPA